MKRRRSSRDCKYAHSFNRFLEIREIKGLVSVSSFWSSLLSAVLTYHVNWLHSYVTEPVEYGDCGTRVLVLTKDPTLAGRLLHVLSFFVRSSVPPEAVQLDGSPKMRPAPAALEWNAKLRDESPSNFSASADWLQMRDEDRNQSPVPRALRKGSSAERRVGSSGSSGRRGSQQLENTRYLRSYYDVRFQLSPDTIAKRDARPFANLMSSIAKNGFQDYYADELADSGVSESKPAFFVGSAPDHFECPRDLAEAPSVNAESEPIQVQISRYCPSPLSSPTLLTQLSRISSYKLLSQT